jgi:hypothetical protein
MGRLVRDMGDNDCREGWMDFGVGAEILVREQGQQLGEQLVPTVKTPRAGEVLVYPELPRYAAGEGNYGLL